MAAADGGPRQQTMPACPMGGELWPNRRSALHHHEVRLYNNVMSATDQPPAPTPPPPPGGEQRRHWSWWLIFLVAVIIGLGVLVVLLWPATAWWVEHVDGIDLHEKDPRPARTF